MKKITSLAGRFFCTTFALYTCVSYGMMLLNILTVNAQAPQWSGVALLFSHVLLFSALTALVHTAVDAFERMNAALGHIIKFVLSYAAFYLCFFALQKNSSEPINVVVMSACFVIIYAVITGAFAIVGAALRRKAKDKEHYESVYGNIKSEITDGEES